MSKIQVFSGYDPLKEFKLIVGEMKKCYFFEHAINGKVIDISSGTNNGIIYQEEIITDGIITAEGMNRDHKFVVWHYNLITLNNGMSIKFKIEKANFFINIVTKDREKEYNIHTEHESEELLLKIIKYLYKHDKGTFDIHSVALQYPSIMVLESYIGGKITKEIEDFSPKVRKKRRRKY